MSISQTFAFARCVEFTELRLFIRHSERSVCVVEESSVNMNRYKKSPTKIVARLSFYIKQNFKTRVPHPYCLYFYINIGAIYNFIK